MDFHRIFNDTVSLKTGNFYLKTFGSSSTSQQASSMQQSYVTKEAKIIVIGVVSKSLREWLSITKE